MKSSIYLSALLAASAFGNVNGTEPTNGTEPATTPPVPTKNQVKTVDGSMMLNTPTVIMFNQGGEVTSVNGILEKIEELSSLLDSTRANLMKVNRDVADVKDDVAYVKGDVANVKGDVADVKGDVASNAKNIGSVQTDMTQYFNNLAKSASCSQIGGAVKVIASDGAVQCSVPISSAKSISDRITSQTTDFMAGYNFYKNKQIRIAMDQITYPTYTKYISVMDMMVDADENNRNLHFDQTYFCARQRDNGPEAYMVWTLPQGTAMTKFILWDRSSNSGETLQLYWTSEYSKMKTRSNFRTNYVKLGSAQFSKELSLSTKSQPVNLVSSQYVADIYTDTSGSSDCFSGATVTFKRVSFPGM